VSNYRCGITDPHQAKERVEYQYGIVPTVAAVKAPAPELPEIEVI
jgi:hypothetical protein